MNGLNNDVPKFVTQARASYLLGMSETELLRISEESDWVISSARDTKKRCISRMRN